MADILVAEDDAGVRGLVARALRMDGHRVVVVEDGEAALEAVIEEPDRYDLVLSDIRMPAMTGIELAHALSIAKPDLPILLMTGYAEQREAADDLVALIQGVVDKPFSLAEIRSRVFEALGSTMPEPIRRYA